MKKSGTQNVIVLLLVFALLSNVALPFYASGTAEGKVAICTAYGVKYISVEEAGTQPDKGKEDIYPHCPLCVLNNGTLMHAPMLKVSDACFYIPNYVSKNTTDEFAVLLTQHDVTPSAPRAPPRTPLT